MWAKLDDGLTDHPKILKVGPLGLALWIAGLVYSSRNLTDGFIPWNKLGTLIDWQYTAESNNDGKYKIWTVSRTSGYGGEDVDSEMVAKMLVTAGLWHEVDSGFRIHDYHDYQPTKVQVLHERSRSNERQKRFRERNAVTNGPVTP